MLCPQLKINPHHQHYLLVLISSIGDGHQTRGRPWLVAFFLSLSKELLLPPIVLLLLRGLPVVKSTSIAPWHIAVLYFPVIWIYGNQSMQRPIEQ